MSDVATFTITLPIAAPLREHVKAIADAARSQAVIGNPEAAQALMTIHALAVQGLLSFEATLTSRNVADIKMNLGAAAAAINELMPPAVPARA